MGKEFNLSEKIDYGISVESSKRHPWGQYIIFVRDVKEFIRLLKEKTYYDDIVTEEFHKKIDKLAGDKLIKGED